MTSIETHLMNHVTFWMPAFVPHITVDFDELFQNSTSTSNTFGRKSSGIVKMAIHVSFVFVI